MPRTRAAVADPVLVMRGVAKSYRTGVPGCTATVRVLDKVNLTVWPGEHIAIVGAPGCGKTTLLLIAAGLLRADAGVVWRARPCSLVCSPRAPRRSTGMARVHEAVRATRDLESAPRPNTLRWTAAAARGAELTVGSGRAAVRGASRVVCLERCCLCGEDECPRESRRAPADRMPDFGAHYRGYTGHGSVTPAKAGRHVSNSTVDRSSLRGTSRAGNAGDAAQPGVSE